MNDRYDFDKLMSESVRVLPASAALQDRAARAIAAKLERRRVPRLTWACVSLVAAVCAIWLVVGRPGGREAGAVLTPALQLSRMAAAAEHVSTAHYRTSWIGPEAQARSSSEAWEQPPYKREIAYLEAARRVSGFDGEVAWHYDTVRRSLSIRRDSRRPSRDGFTVDHISKSLEQWAREGSLTLTSETGPDGRLARVLTYSNSFGERLIAYADPATDLPWRIDSYTKERDDLNRPVEGAAWTLVKSIEVDYPAPLPPEFFQADAPPDYERVVLDAVPPLPSVAEVQESLAREPIAVLHGPEGSAAPVLDVALCGDLAFVAYGVERGETDDLSLDVFAELSGYLKVMGLVESDGSFHYGESILTGGEMVGGGMYCTPDRDSKQPRPASIAAYMSLGRRPLETTVRIPPEHVRTVTEPPAWWLGLYGHPLLVPDVAWVRAKYWLSRDPHKAAHYADEVVAQQYGATHPSHCEQWKLLGDARQADGDSAGALAAYDSGLALLPALESRSSDHWRRELEQAKSRITGQPSGSVRTPAQGTQGE